MLSTGSLVDAVGTGSSATGSLATGSLATGEGVVEFDAAGVESDAAGAGDGSGLTSTVRAGGLADSLAVAGAWATVEVGAWVTAAAGASVAAEASVAGGASAAAAAGATVSETGVGRATPGVEPAAVTIGSAS